MSCFSHGYMARRFAVLTKRRADCQTLYCEYVPFHVFPAIFEKGNNFNDSLFASLQNKTCPIEGASLREQFLQS